MLDRQTQCCGIVAIILSGVPGIPGIPTWGQGGVGNAAGWTRIWGVCVCTGERGSGNNSLRMLDRQTHCCGIVAIIMYGVPGIEDTIRI